MYTPDFSLPSIQQSPRELTELSQQQLMPQDSALHSLNHSTYQEAISTPQPFSSRRKIVRVNEQPRSSEEAVYSRTV